MKVRKRRHQNKLAADNQQQSDVDSAMEDSSSGSDDDQSDESDDEHLHAHNPSQDGIKKGHVFSLSIARFKRALHIV